MIDTPSDIFVVMEFVPGGELFDYIVSRGRLPPDEARRFFHQVNSSHDSYYRTDLLIFKFQSTPSLTLAHSYVRS